MKEGTDLSSMMGPMEVCAVWGGEPMSGSAQMVSNETRLWWLWFGLLRLLS